MTSASKNKFAAPGAHKLISCIMPNGVALGVQKKLKEVHSILSSNVSPARGVGKITPLAYRGIAGQSEKEILTVEIEADRADEIFSFIYEVADINRPHGGIMYMHPLHMTTRFSLPDLPEEE